MAPEEFSQEPAAPTETSAETFANRLDEAAGAGNSESTQGAVPAEQPQQEQFSGHPAWKPFEEALGEHYRSIEPHLRSMSQAFESKITATNQKLKPWEGFIERNIDPQQLDLAYGLAQRLDSDPLGVYKQLEDFLRQTGQLEAAQQVAQAAEAQAGAENEELEEDPRIAQLQAQIANLSQGQQQFMQAQQERFQQEQFEAQVRTASTELENEVQALKAQGADDRTIGNVIDRAELLYHRTGKPTPLAEIYAQVQQEQDFIRNQPRPVDRAPRLPGVTGGAPSQGSVDLSSASRSQSVDTFAQMLQAAKQGN